jgi:hypothetical protein
MSILIVDGYNIINQWSYLKKELEKSGLEHTRNKLIEIMAEYQSFTGNKVIVVFDAHLSENPQIAKSNKLGVEVIFSKRNQTADSLIERLVYKERGTGKTILVASRDVALERIIFGLDCFIISPDKLEDMVNKIKSDIKTFYKN